MFKVYKSEKYYYPCIDFAYGRCDEKGCTERYTHIDFCVYCAHKECTYGVKCKKPQAVRIHDEFWKVGNVGIVFRPRHEERVIMPTVETVDNNAGLILTELTQNNIDKNIELFVNSFNKKFISCVNNVTNNKKVRTELEKMSNDDKLITNLIAQLSEVQKNVRTHIRGFEALVVDQEKIQARSLEMIGNLSQNKNVKKQG